MRQPESNTPSAPAGAAPRQELSLFDSICIIVGIIVGVGIYNSTPIVAASVPHAWGVLLVWTAGGVLSLAGALCYAELAAAHPQEGGDYVYLNRAYGPGAGFLFAWSDLAIIRPGSIAAMAFPFADYFSRLHAPFAHPFLAAHATTLYASLAVVVLTLVHILGVRQGKWVQNLLTMGKVAGILAIFAVACLAQGKGFSSPAAGGWTADGVNLAMIMVLFAYGGWNQLGYVAAEVKNPSRNLVRALILGTLGVTVIYLLVNAAFLHTLGHAGMAKSQTVATDTVAAAFPAIASKAISVLICVSALGAVSGMIFAGARIVYAMGREHAFFRVLGRWSQRRGTPVWALSLQGLLSVLMIVIIGSFKSVVIYTTTVTWTFFLAVGIGVFRLRWREPNLPRPYRISGHPFTTLLFCACCLFLIYSAVVYDVKQFHGAGTLVSLAIIGLGFVIYRLSPRIHPPANG